VVQSKMSRSKNPFRLASKRGQSDGPMGRMRVVFLQFLKILCGEVLPPGPEGGTRALLQKNRGVRGKKGGGWQLQYSIYTVHVTAFNLN
jgi:hypothetical protein